MLKHPREHFADFDGDGLADVLLCESEGWAGGVEDEVVGRAPGVAQGAEAVGIDQSRLSLLLAVLEKRAGLHLVADDVYVNLAGGMSIEEPAVDLAIVAAVASSLRNRPIASGTVVFGEVGLGGEVRGVAQANLRIREAEQMGFTRIVLPASNMDASEEMGKAQLVGVRSVGEALDQLLA